MTKKAFQVFQITLPANESRQILFQGTYFKLLSATGAVDVTIEGQGTIPDLTSGRGLKDTAYSRLILTDKTGASNSIELFCATEEYVDQTFSGVVTLANVNGPFTQAAKTVTNSSAQLLAANSARRYLLIQNNDASGIIYVTLDGTAATTAKGIKIEAGGSYECQGYVPTGEIRAIGSLASNGNVVAVEG
jgi:hypothetical protein